MLSFKCTFEFAMGFRRIHRAVGSLLIECRSRLAVRMASVSRDSYRDSPVVSDTNAIRRNDSPSLVGPLKSKTDVD